MIENGGGLEEGGKIPKHDFNHVIRSVECFVFAFYTVISLVI